MPLPAQRKRNSLKPLAIELANRLCAGYHRCGHGDCCCSWYACLGDDGPASLTRSGVVSKWRLPPVKDSMNSTIITGFSAGMVFRILSSARGIGACVLELGAPRRRGPLWRKCLRGKSPRRNKRPEGGRNWNVSCCAFSEP